MIHYSSVIVSAMASQITVVSIVCSTVCSGVNQRKHQISASLAFVSGIHRWPADSPHKRPVTRKMILFDDTRARFLSLSQTCLRTVLDSNNLLSFLAETIRFSITVLGTRSQTAAKSAHPVTWSCLSTFWDNWTGVTKVPQVTRRKIWK